MKRFRFPDDGDVARDLRETYGYHGELGALYAGNLGPRVHKWHHYIPLYDRYFTPYRHKPLKMLEIGVNKGGSLQMWRRFFGPQAVLFGIDINPECADYDGQAGQVRIGSQDDPAFLDAVVAEMGGLDLVLDDGSHRMDHVRATFLHLFPKLAAGGLYMIEDLHTAYLPRFGGGYDAQANLFNIVRELVDDMHRWYHDHGQRYPGVGDHVGGVHLHDSIVVIEKTAPRRPTHSRVGG